MMINDNVLLITGSGRGIGAATALLAAERGYSICLNYLNDEKSAVNVRDKILSRGGKCIAIRADVSDERQVIAMFDDIDRQLGAITHLVNNVGILKQKMAMIDMDGERFQQVLLTNVMSHFYCSREAIKRMSLSRGGAEAPSSTCHPAQRKAVPLRIR